MRGLVVSCWDSQHRWVYRAKEGEVDAIAWLAFLAHLEQYHHFSLGDWVSERMKRGLPM